MLNRRNGDIPPQLVLLMVEELEIDVVQSAIVLSGSEGFTLGGP